jgi:sensor c-di-GMP phosphodiesterase-like protein
MYFIYKMFALDRETATILAVVVCIAASVYLYRELKGSKDEITKITSFLDKVKEEEKQFMEQQEQMKRQMQMNRQAQASQQAPEASQPKPKTSEKRVTRGQSPVNKSLE